MAKNCKGCKYYSEKEIWDDFYEAYFYEDICHKGHNILIWLPCTCKHKQEGVYPNVKREK